MAKASTSSLSSLGAETNTALQCQHTTWANGDKLGWHNSKVSNLWSRYRGFDPWLACYVHQPFAWPLRYIIEPLTPCPPCRIMPGTVPSHRPPSGESWSVSTLRIWGRQRPISGYGKLPIACYTSGHYLDEWLSVDW